jgi:hypothetical protein
VLRRQAKHKTSESLDLKNTDPDAYEKLHAECVDECAALGPDIVDETNDHEAYYKWMAMDIVEFASINDKE